MSGQWEQYVESASEALTDSDHNGIQCYSPMPIEATARAVLAAVGPLIVADTQQRMVEAAARAVEREVAGEPAESKPTQHAGRPVIICEPARDCKDPHLYRHHCMRGHELDDMPAVPGVCPLKVCEQRGANR